MHHFRYTLHTFLLFLLPLMAGAQKTEETTPQITDSIQRMIAQNGSYILETFADGKKVDIDYQKVEEYVTQNAEGYEQLMNRFQEDPNSLNEEETALLYYGFAFTKDYEPNNVDMNVGLRKEFQNKNFFAYQKELKRTPVSLSLLMNAAYLAGEMGNDVFKQKYMQKAMKLLTAIMASGTGYSKENAIKVLYIADEYAIFRDLMGLRMKMQDFIDRRYDRMTLETGNGGESVILWFDTYLSIQKLGKDDGNHKKKKKKK